MTTHDDYIGLEVRGYAMPKSDPDAADDRDSDPEAVHGRIAELVDASSHTFRVELDNGLQVRIDIIEYRDGILSSPGEFPLMADLEDGTRVMLDIQGVELGYEVSHSFNAIRIEDIEHRMVYDSKDMEPVDPDLWNAIMSDSKNIIEAVLLPLDFPVTITYGKLTVNNNGEFQTWYEVPAWWVPNPDRAVPRSDNTVIAVTGEDDPSSHLQNDPQASEYPLFIEEQPED